MRRHPKSAAFLTSDNYVVIVMYSKPQKMDLWKIFKNIFGCANYFSAIDGGKMTSNFWRCKYAVMDVSGLRCANDANCLTRKCVRVPSAMRK